MNPKYVLIVVEKPFQKNHDTWSRWLQFRDNTPAIVNLPAHAEKLAENVWLLNLEKGLSPTLALLNRTSQNNLNYRAWFLSEPPTWIYPDSGPESLERILKNPRRASQ